MSSLLARSTASGSPITNYQEESCRASTQSNRVLRTEAVVQRQGIRSSVFAQS